jgi:hypothetical protein
MIQIQTSPTADTRTCDPATVTKEVLLASSHQHIADVNEALLFFVHYLRNAASVHDADKIFDIDWFHSDFITGFKQTGWWDNHRKINRHHLAQEDGVPHDVNLLDVLEYVADCVMAGCARSGKEKCYPPTITSELLERAFQNTVSLLMKEVEVV